MLRLSIKSFLNFASEFCSFMVGEWFSSWFDSPYYHILYQSHDDREAKHFIDSMLHLLDFSPGARLLDLACGKGRHARYLAEKGFDVTGVDISPSSIDFARHFEQERLAFYQHDMRLPFRYNYFDGILNIFTSFGYFSTDQDHLRTLINVEKGLNPGGLFLLDYFNTHWVRSHLLLHEVKHLDGITFRLNRRIRGERVYKKVEFETEGRSFTFREQVRLFTLQEFYQMFEAAGLEIRQFYGDYELRRFNADQSRRLIIVAQKPH